MVDETALLGSARGSIIAPAGCGKTELIARAARRQECAGALILTHTHAGVSAIRDRLRRLKVSRGHVHVATIAGWCLKYASSYPVTAGLVSREPVRDQWDSVYESALRMLPVRAIQGVIRATYSRVIVDEYQDCTMAQHKVIAGLSNLIPTFVLGDPLQGIFGFAGGCLGWASDVEPQYPPMGSLIEPWRWKGKNEKLGKWLLDVRDPLSRGEAIRLDDAPVTWCEVTPNGQRDQAHRLSRAKGRIIAIRKRRGDAHGFARSLGGSYPSMEEMECNDLLRFADDLDQAAGAARAARVLRFADACLTEVGTKLTGVLNQLDFGVIPSPTKYPKMGLVVGTLVRVAETDSAEAVRAAMDAIERVPGAKLFRRELWREAKRSLLEFEGGGYPTVRQAAWSLRNRHRVVGRAVDPRAVSRTLLVKGLEYEHALILNADEFEDPRRPGDGARNFYVAATRGSTSLTVLSKSSVVRFSAPKL